MSPAQLLRSREGGAYRARAFRPEDATMKRRVFLASTAALALVPSLGLAGDSPVILWADGVHDDSAAIQHVLNGGTAYRLDGTPVRLVNNTVVIRPEETLYLERTVRAPHIYKLARASRTTQPIRCVCG